MRDSLVARAVFVVLCCVGATAFAAVDTTEVLYQSATMGTPAANGGDVVAVNQYLGARFVLTERRVATALGGHFGTFQAGEQTAFAALIRLTSMTDFPDSGNPLDTPDVLATTVFTLPRPSNDVIVAIAPVDLAPGTYAVLFGAGQFGTNGLGFSAQTNTPVGTESDFFYSGSTAEYRDGGFFQNRFVVYGGIPEPGAAILLMLIAPVSLLRGNRRRRRAPQAVVRRESSAVTVPPSLGSPDPSARSSPM
jgi:hypothetical protein